MSVLYLLTFTITHRYTPLQSSSVCYNVLLHVFFSQVELYIKRDFLKNRKLKINCVYTHTLIQSPAIERAATCSMTQSLAYRWHVYCVEWLFTTLEVPEVCMTEKQREHDHLCAFVLSNWTFGFFLSLLSYSEFICIDLFSVEIITDVVFYGPWV